MPILELKDVRYSYSPEKVVLRGVNCVFECGTLYALVGKSGAGKSTLLRIIAGLSRPSAGEVIFDGTGAGGVAREDGPRLAYLGHATFVYPGLSALENLQFWARAHGLRPSRAELLTLLEHVGLAAHAEERAGVFSRGMAQRLNLARVLLLDADLVLLDEPGTGLDVNSMALVRREMLAARERGACVIVVSHDLAGDDFIAVRAGEDGCEHLGLAALVGHAEHIGGIGAVVLGDGRAVQLLLGDAPLLSELSDAVFHGGPPHAKMFSLLYI